MEPPSGPASRRHVPWNRLLLAVSLLTFRTPPTTAQLTVETVPPLAAEGLDVLLLAHNVTKNPLGYAWYRGERVDNAQLIASYRVDNNATTNGSVYSRRETLYPNGTLLIQNVAQKDTGSYTLLVTKKDLQTERQIGHLHVHPVLPSPVITSNNSNPREHEDTVVLTCGSETQNTSYMWWIKSQSLPKSMRLELSEDKRTLTVVTVTRNDTGPYVCEARNPVSVSRSDPFTLDVLWRENSRALSVGAITGIVIGVLLVLTPLAVLGCFIFLHRGNWPPASTSGRGPSGSSVSQASLPDARAPAPIYQLSELIRPNTDVYCHISHKADVGP
ncbi:carcinoembryonic antigen-related cell adhesion molecule 6-like [Budorcas taxicolor]|uniref:carcinoembryonic antigen-related cell adhesion molecule 6-like n=1 Tax=Budorcas taxicolor TaxID=37181 RepID=UPI0022847534|nr:carcinoembryonic antigen-related cell adhesion molecule 6-like [Budorcas taxicolor]